MSKNDSLLGFLGGILNRYGQHDGPLLAGAIAYYGLLSLFPFLLFALAVLTIFIPLESLQGQIVALAEMYLPAPGSVEFVRKNLQHVIEARGEVGLVALVATLWGASTIFFVLSRALNRLFDGHEDSSIVRHRLVAVLVVLVLGFFLLLSIVASTYFRVVTVSIGVRHLLPQRGDLLWKLGASLLPLVLTTVVFAIAYRYIPTGKTAWEAVGVGAVVGGVGFELLKLGFRLYIERLSPYALIYGSVATVIVLLLWIYIGAAVFLLGGAVAAEVDHRVFGTPNT
jgi:membrane protein